MMIYMCFCMFAYTDAYIMTMKIELRVNIRSVEVLT